MTTRERVIALKEQRIKNSEIATTLGISRQRVDQILNRPCISQTTRDRIHRKYKNKCQWCGKGKLIHIHHIDLNPGNNSDDNLILLCANCHKKFHRLNKDQRSWEAAIRVNGGITKDIVGLRKYY